jgi:3-isopropylmalate dehydrogenase
MQAKIVLLPGDGIGPEIVAEARRVLERVGERFGHDFRSEEELVGGAAMDAGLGPLPESTLAACRAADAVLLGAVGGPKWDDPGAETRPEAGLLALRQELGLYANLRPVQSHPALMAASPLKPERVRGVDCLVVRELTGGIYFGHRAREKLPDGTLRVTDTLTYTDVELRRVLKVAFELARQRRGLVTSVDKANVLESSRLWRQVSVEVAREYPDVRLEHQLVDSCAMRLVLAPTSFDVIVTENMFGDILSDEAAVITGSLGMLPSASLGDGRPGLYEPIHGSAPDIAGLGRANPLGTILSLALLLRHSLGLETEARAVETAVFRAVGAGARTRDLGGGDASLSTAGMGQAVLAELG